MDYTRLGFFGTVGLLGAVVIAPEITIPVLIGGAATGALIDTVSQAAGSSITDNKGNNYTNWTPFPTTTTIDANGNAVETYSWTQTATISAVIIGVLYLYLKKVK